MDDNWTGVPGSCEHRTVGPYRAWVYDTNEWCYPEALCYHCDQLDVPEQWRGEYVGSVLADLRQKVLTLCDIAIYKEENLSAQQILDLLDGLPIVDNPLET